MGNDRGAESSAGKAPAVMNSCGPDLPDEHEKLLHKKDWVASVNRCDPVEVPEAMGASGSRMT
jgi:hypothetical protein